MTHRVSLMVLQAGALRMTVADEATRQAAEELRAAGCQALAAPQDLAGILGAGPEADQTPAAAGFAALDAESTAVGTPAELVEEGYSALASPVAGRAVGVEAVARSRPAWCSWTCACRAWTGCTPSSAS